MRNPELWGSRFLLEGHTDATGSEAYNMKLSKRRAESALNYLLTNYEIDPAAVRATGYGEERPVVLGTSSESRRMNRRVVIEQLP